LAGALAQTVNAVAFLGTANATINSRPNHVRAHGRMSRNLMACLQARCGKHLERTATTNSRPLELTIRNQFDGDVAFYRDDG
jgi:hypothetical protein